MSQKVEMALIGRRLKEARQRSRVKQEEAAQAVSTTRTTISNWEAGRNLPCLVQFRGLLALYGETGYHILFGDNPFEITKEEAAELSQLARTASPGLRRRIDVLLTLLSTAGGDHTKG